MKYLIRNRKEFAITVAAAVAAIVNFVNAIRSGVVSEDTIIALIVTVLGVLAWYYNMPTSAENDKATAEMRQAKAEHKEGSKGEQFFDEEIDEDEDAEGDDYED